MQTRIQGRTAQGHGIKRAFFPDPDARWNYVYVYKKEELQGTPVVISHRPIPRNQIK